MLEKINELSKIIDLLLKETNKLDNKEQATTEAINYFYNKKERILNELAEEIETKDKLIEAYVNYFVKNELGE